MQRGIRAPPSLKPRSAHPQGLPATHMVPPYVSPRDSPAFAITLVNTPSHGRADSPLAAPVSINAWGSTGPQTVGFRVGPGTGAGNQGDAWTPSARAHDVSPPPSRSRKKDRSPSPLRVHTSAASPPEVDLFLNARERHVSTMRGTNPGNANTSVNVTVKAAASTGRHGRGRGRGRGKGRRRAQQRPVSALAGSRRSLRRGTGGGSRVTFGSMLHTAPHAQAASGRTSGSGRSTSER